MQSKSCEYVGFVLVVYFNCFFASNLLIACDRIETEQFFGAICFWLLLIEKTFTSIIDILQFVLYMVFISAISLIKHIRNLFEFVKIFREKPNKQIAVEFFQVKKIKPIIH